MQFIIKFAPRQLIFNLKNKKYYNLTKTMTLLEPSTGVFPVNQDCVHSAILRVKENVKPGFRVWKGEKCFTHAGLAIQLQEQAI